MKPLNIVAFIIIIFFLTLVFFQTKSIRKGPSIISLDLEEKVSVEKQFLELNSKAIQVSGEVRKGASLQINGESMPIFSDGTFSSTLTLPFGYNIVSLSTKDRFGKEKKQDRALWID